MTPPSLCIYTVRPPYVVCGSSETKGISSYYTVILHRYTKKLLYTRIGQSYRSNKNKVKNLTNYFRTFSDVQENRTGCCYLIEIILKYSVLTISEHPQPSTTITHPLKDLTSNVKPEAIK